MSTTHEATGTRTKVAILGGGGGGISAAMELTATKALRDRYDVTIYTPGWRLGGKAASGRNAQDHQRIEEHGIHVMFGFYENAFQMIQAAYAENGRPKGAPLATWEDAFTALDHLVVYDVADDGTPTGFTFKAPKNDGVPGQPMGIDFGQVVETALGHTIHAIEALFGIGVERGHHAESHGSDTSPGLIGRLIAWFRKLIGRVEQAVDKEAHRLLLTLERTLERDIGRMAAHELDPIIRTIRAIRDVFYRVWVKHHLDDPTIRFYFTTIDLVGTMLGGIVDDDLIGEGFWQVNGEELRAWLRRHRAEPVTVDTNPLLRALYDLTFAYEDGDIDKPNVAAGQALEAMIRIVVAYQGHIVYKMNAGMGDTIFGPCYEVLSRRGVNFEFFHWVDRLGVDPDSDSITSIDLFEQTTPAADYPYLVDVGGLPSWPNEPDWSRIADGDRLRGVDLEHEPNPLDRPVTTLHRGVDFDKVVLTISIGGLTNICADVADRNPRVRAMLDDSATVATQAFQVWSNEIVNDPEKQHPKQPNLGWAYDADSIAGAYLEPINTYCNMSQVIDRETWPAGEVKSIGYFCGPLKEPGGDHAEALAEVRDRATTYFEDQSSWLWPNARTGENFQWDALVDPSGASGSKRIAAQYFRANTRGTERYVLTPAGKVKSRLWPHDTGFENLVFAGDWTRNGIDGGSFEAAVASGRLAAKAISGYPTHVPGTTGVLVDSTDDTEVSAPRYVEFGGLDTFPGPYNCKNTTLYGFAVRANETKLKELIDRVLTIPSDGARRFAPLGPFVMLSLGDIVNVIPTTPPYDTMGSVNEKQVAVWVPCAEVTERNGKLKAERFWMFTSYIWVDNALSMATGREVYGWPKSLGQIKLPDDQDQSFGLDTYGLQYALQNQPAFIPLLEMHPGKQHENPVKAVGETLKELVEDIRTVIEDAHDEHLKNTWDIDAGLVDDIVTEAIPEVYLKQIRSIEHGADAAYQAICGSRAQIESIKFERFMVDYELKIHHVDSHPLGTDLGIADQTVLAGYSIEMDFLQDVGAVLWEAPPGRL